MDQTAPDTIDLRDYIMVLLRQWRLVALVTAGVLVTALAVSFLQTPVYESGAELAIEPVRSGSDAALEDLLLRDEIVETERRVILSRNTTDRVIADLGLDITSAELLRNVSVRTINNTRVVTISATDTDPQFAAAVANSFATSYLDYRRDRALDEVTAARSNLDNRARDLQAQVDTIDRELGGDVDDALGTIAPDDQALVAQRDALVQQIGQIGIQLASLDPGAQAIRGGGEILVPAEPGLSPVSPRPLRTGVLALVLGLMLAVGAAFLRDHFDDAIRNEDDVVRAGNGHAVVGRLTTWDDDSADERLITLVDPFAGASEEFQAMAANVRFALIGRARATSASLDGTAAGDYAQRSVAVTSSTPGEGKTTVAGNLAVAAAAAGRRVLLVGADLRKPTLASRFGLPDGLGLTDLLANAGRMSGRDSITEHLIDVGIPRLRLLPAGSIPPNPTELLASNQMAWLHSVLTSMADLVIYDTPPVLPVADTLEISQHVDLTFIVARTEQCHRRELQHAVDRLEAVGTTIGGLVINGLAAGRSGYGYGYGSDEYRPRPTTPTTPTAPSGAFSSRAPAATPGPERRPTEATGPATDAPGTGSDRLASPVTAPDAPPARADDTADDLDTWLFKNR